MTHRMTSPARWAAALLLAGLLAAGSVAAQGAPPEGGVLGLVPEDAVTAHVLETAEGDLPYTATAGSIDLFGQSGALRAKVFYTAYVAEGAGDGDGAGAGRPVTFAFNGGPGAASAYLQMGLVGPWVAEIGPGQDDGTTPELAPNPDSWLAFTDLVLIDPVGSGWSRAVSDAAARDFWGVRQDADSLARVIARYVEVNDRLASPKYLLGESYGGFRAAKVANALRERQGLLVAGIVMVSPMIEAGFLSGVEDDPLTAALQFPSLAAARMERDGVFDPEAVAAAERFAMTEYLVALAGAPPEGAAAERLYDRVAGLTGVPVDLVARARGFVGGLYQDHAAGEGRVASPYDGGQTAAGMSPEAGASRQEDAVLDGYTRAYGPAFAAHARRNLGVESAMTYTLLNLEANRRWDWGPGRSSASASGDLRDLMSVIPSFRLAILHGYSDTLTPYGVSRYVLDHLPAGLGRDRAGLHLYRGGHMFYTDPASRAAAAADMRAFYEAPATN